MNLIEKLEQEITRLDELRSQEKAGSTQSILFGHHIVATHNCINIVKQHSDWVSVDERLPTHSDTYPAMADGRFGIAKFDAEYKAWLFKNFEVYELMANVTHWQEKPQSPSEVQA